MKKILIINFIIYSFIASAQVAIGKSSLSSSSVSLEFGDSNPINGYRGVVLPWVTSEADLSSTPVNGTIIFDLSTYKVKVKKTAAGWTDLTVKDISQTLPGITNQTVDTSLQDTKTDLPSARVIIGDPRESASGILILNTNRAMVLPKVPSPHLNIKSPSAGMMAFDTDTNKLAIFNGSVWTFWSWKP